VNKKTGILVIEPSLLICKGLEGLLNQNGQKYQFSFTDSMEGISQHFYKREFEIILINPSYIYNNPTFFHSFKNRFDKVKWVGLVYAFYDQKLLSMLDGSISIYDSVETIFSSLNRMLTEESQAGQNSSQDILSERETDVLKLLANGMANKEIADKLHISTNTVITHRKNISHKTGIKTVSGLTIYAVVQKLVSIDSLSE
jgi:DNA-binding CsgD family transcriptional regulator